MRMWLVNPKLLCNQHLLGEHHEAHMIGGSIIHGLNITGYITNGLVETEKVQERHDILAIEMESRGMHHKSPIKTSTSKYDNKGHVDIQANLIELSKRCLKCRKRIKEED